MLGEAVANSSDAKRGDAQGLWAAGGRHVKCYVGPQDGLSHGRIDVRAVGRRDADGGCRVNF
jgi:hypothetical protein